MPRRDIEVEPLDFEGCQRCQVTRADHDKRGCAAFVPMGDVQPALSPTAIAELSTYIKGDVREGLPDITVAEALRQIRAAELRGAPLTSEKLLPHKGLTDNALIVVEDNRVHLSAAGERLLQGSRCAACAKGDHGCCDRGLAFPLPCVCTSQHPGDVPPSPATGNAPVQTSAQAEEEEPLGPFASMMKNVPDGQLPTAADYEQLRGKLMADLLSGLPPDPALPAESAADAWWCEQASQITPCDLNSRQARRHMIPALVKLLLAAVPPERTKPAIEPFQGGRLRMGITITLNRVTMPTEDFAALAKRAGLSMPPTALELYALRGGDCAASEVLSAAFARGDSYFGPPRAAFSLIVALRPGHEAEDRRYYEALCDELEKLPAPPRAQGGA